MDQNKRANILTSLTDLVDRAPLYLFLILIPVLLFAHNPHALLHAEFWGEDGAVWYRQAADAGIASLLQADGGYLNSIQRIAAIAAQPFPLAWGPTLFAIFALCMQSAPAIFLLSDRLKTAWPSKASRLAFALLFILMPDAVETSINVTNSQWYLAILAFLILVSDCPKSRMMKFVDLLILFVSGLSGPFCVLFFPIGFLRVLSGNDQHRFFRMARLVVLGITSCIQIFLILGLSHAGRETGPLGASVESFIRISALIPMGAATGYTGLVSLFNQSTYGFLTALCGAVVALLVFSVAFIRGPRILREFIFFSATMFILALMKPLISLSLEQWPLMLHKPINGNRYFLYPMLAWWGGLFMLASFNNVLSKGIAFSLLALTIFVAVPSDWGDVLKYPSTDFVARAHQFDASMRGTVMDLPEHPTGLHMTLIQRNEPVVNGNVSLSEQDLALAQTNHGLCSIDRVDGKVIENSALKISTNSVHSFYGWAAPSEKTKTVRAIMVLLGENTHYAFTTSLGIFRPDVVSVFSSPNVLKSGYSSAISFKDVALGSYSLRVLVFGKITVESCDTSIRITVAAN